METCLASPAHWDGNPEVTGWFPSKWVSNTDRLCFLWCWPVKAVEQIYEYVVNIFLYVERRLYLITSTVVDEKAVWFIFFNGRICLFIFETRLSFLGNTLEKSIADLGHINHDIWLFHRKETKHNRPTRMLCGIYCREVWFNAPPRNVARFCVAL